MEPSEFIRESIIEPAEYLYACASDAYKEIDKACKWLDRHVETFVQTQLPANAHHLAMSLFRTLPETVVCGTLMTGVSAAPAVLYLGVRVVAISVPHVQELIANLIDAKAIASAVGKTAAELFALYKNFRPAIAMCAAIATVASVVFGWSTGSLSLMMRAPLYATVTYLAVADILRDAVVAPLINVGGDVPPGNGAAGQPSRGDQERQNIRRQDSESSLPNNAPAIVAAPPLNAGGGVPPGNSAERQPTRVSEAARVSEGNAQPSDLYESDALFDKYAEKYVQNN